MATVTPNNNWPVPTSTDYVADGAVAIEALGDAIDASVGDGLLTWTAYTPSFTNLTLGASTLTFVYAKLGKIVHVRGGITMGAGFSITGTVGISTPTNTVSSSGQPPIGHARFNDASPSTSYDGGVIITGGSTVVPYTTNVAGTYPTIQGIGTNVPMTWAVGDALLVYMTYQAA
jgi:hypothetical protein